MHRRHRRRISEEQSFFSPELSKFSTLTMSSTAKVENFLQIADTSRSIVDPPDRQVAVSGVVMVVLVVVVVVIVMTEVVVVVVVVLEVVVVVVVVVVR